MTMFAHLFHAALLIAIQVSVFAANIKTGDKVAAKGLLGVYYYGTIAGTSDGKFDLDFIDGTKGKSIASDLIAVDPAAKFKIGDHVLALWKGSTMYPGVISATKAATVTVKWDDGDLPLDVPRNQVVLFKGGAANPAGAGSTPRNPAKPPVGTVKAPVGTVKSPAGTAKLPVGTPVAAKWKFDSVYIATITGVEADGQYSVKYGDGTSGQVVPGDVTPVNPTQELPVGAHVRACWKGAIMYPGTVTARHGNLYMIKWDDGDTPVEVEREKIAPLPAR